MPDRRAQNFQKWTGCGRYLCEETHYPLRSYISFWFRSVLGLAGLGLIFFVAAPVVLCFSFVTRSVDNSVLVAAEPCLHSIKAVSPLPLWFTAHYFPVLMNEKKSRTAEQEICWIIFAVNSLSPHLSYPGDLISDQNKYIWGFVYFSKEWKSLITLRLINMLYSCPHGNNLMLRCFCGFGEEYFTDFSWGVSFFLGHQATVLTNTAKWQRGMGVLQLIADEESCC